MMIHFNLFRYFLDFLEYFEDTLWMMIHWIFRGKIWMMIHYNLFRYFLIFFDFFRGKKYECWFNDDDDPKKLITTQTRQPIIRNLDQKVNQRCIEIYWTRALYYTGYRYSQTTFSQTGGFIRGLWSNFPSFRWISENWLKFFNWVKILKWGWNSEIWSKVWNLLKMMRRTYNF